MDTRRRIPLEETDSTPGVPAPAARTLLEPAAEDVPAAPTGPPEDDVPSRAPLRWRAVSGGVALGLLLLLLHTLDTLGAMLRESPLSGMAWSAVFVLVAGGAGHASWRMWQRLRQARRHEERRARARHLLAHDGFTEARVLCTQLARETGVEGSPAHLRWQRQLAEAHNDQEVLQLYSRTVLAETDAHALSAVSRHAGDVAVMVAVSYFPAVDMLLVLWRQLKLVEDVAAAYGVDPGYWGRVRLLRKVLRNMALAGAAEIATEVGAEVLGAGVMAKLSAAAAQGVAAGVLTARLGLRAMEACRAVPWEEDERPRLRQVTSGVLANAKRYLSAGEKPV